MRKDLYTFLTETFPLAEEVKYKISTIIKSETFRKKEYLLKIGSISNNIYFIEKGLVRICYLNDDGGEICSGLLCEGELPVSVSSFFDREVSYEFIQALEDTTVHYISYDELESLYRDYLEFNIVGRLLITRHYILSERRNYLLRGKTAKEKFTYFKEKLGHLEGRVPRKDIASYLGITLETLSRLGY